MYIKPIKTLQQCTLIFLAQFMLIPGYLQYNCIRISCKYNVITEYLLEG
jgi:hypothetical protein